jgi:membrane protease subunit (stomatin/prohibitin family)
VAIIDRIKFDGIPGTNWLIYKYPGESFVTSSQLIVGIGQVAVFVKGGRACDSFAAGTYTLSTSNIPILKTIVNIPFGGRTPFAAEIYFINVATMLNLNWGTVDPIQVIDPKYSIELRVRGFGQIGIKIVNHRLFLIELIGSLGSNIVVSYEKVMEFFKGMLNSRIKTVIADAIINKGISALEMSARLDEFSEFAKQSVQKEFGKFGLEVVNLFVASINFPNEDFDAINKVLKDKAAFDLMGDKRYTTKRSFDVMETMADNEGTAGGFMGAGLGLGVGMASAAGLTHGTGAIASAINVEPAAQGPIAAEIHCAKCGKGLLADAKFCQECGQPVLMEKFCQKCGCKVAADQKYCHKCGNQLTL